MIVIENIREYIVTILFIGVVVTALAVGSLMCTPIISRLVAKSKMRVASRLVASHRIAVASPRLVPVSAYVRRDTRGATRKSIRRHSRSLSRGGGCVPWKSAKRLKNIFKVKQAVARTKRARKRKGNGL